MNADERKRFRQIEGIFCAALERPPGTERDALVRAMSVGDAGLCREVELLLEDHQRIRSAARHPEAGASDSTLSRKQS